MNLKSSKTITLFAIDPDDGTLEYITLFQGINDLKRIADNYQKHSISISKTNNQSLNGLLNEHFNLKTMTFNDADYYVYGLNNRNSVDFGYVVAIDTMSSMLIDTVK